MSGSTKGGFNIGSVGGNTSFSAGGDMVAGDKITQTTTTTTVNNGFKQDDDKQKFLQQIDELRAALRELQTKTAEAHTIERYGAAVIPQDSSLADWPLSYADLEPYFSGSRPSSPGGGEPSPGFQAVMRPISETLPSPAVSVKRPPLDRPCRFFAHVSSLTLPAYIDSYPVKAEI